jgi:hypothetical protein
LKVFTLKGITVVVWIVAGSKILLRIENKSDGSKHTTHCPIEGKVLGGELVAGTAYRIAYNTVFNVFGRNYSLSSPKKIEEYSSNDRQVFVIFVKDLDVMTPIFSKNDLFVFVGKEKSLMIQKPAETILHGRIYLSEDNIRMLWEEIWQPQRAAVQIEQ